MFRAAFCRPQELEQQQQQQEQQKPLQARDVAEDYDVAQAAESSTVNLALGGKRKKYVAENKRPSGLNVQPVATQESDGQQNNSSSSNNNGRRNKKKAARVDGEEGQAENRNENASGNENGNGEVKAPVEQVSADAPTENSSRQAAASKLSWADEIAQEDAEKAAAANSDISPAQNQDQSVQQSPQQQQQQQDEQVIVQQDQPSAAVSASAEGVISDGAPVPSGIRRHSSPSSICPVEMMSQESPQFLCYPSPYPPQFSQGQMFYPQGHTYAYFAPPYQYAPPQPVYHQQPPPPPQQQQQEYYPQSNLFNPDTQPPVQVNFPDPANYQFAYGMPFQPNMHYGYVTPEYHRYMMMLQQQQQHAMMYQQQYQQPPSPSTPKFFTPPAGLTVAYHVKDSKNNVYPAHWRYNKQQVDKLVETLNKYANPNPLLENEQNASKHPPTIDDPTVLNRLAGEMGPKLFEEFVVEVNDWRSQMVPIFPGIEKKARTINRANDKVLFYQDGLAGESDETFVTAVSSSEHFRQIQNGLADATKEAARQAREDRRQQRRQQQRQLQQQQQQQQYIMMPMMYNPYGIPIPAQ